MTIDEIKSSLAASFQIVRPYLSFAAIYGSMTGDVNRAHDCDLLVVAAVHHESNEWKALRTRIAEIGPAFKEMYRRPLNVVLLSQNEWVENGDMFKGMSLLEFA